MSIIYDELAHIGPNTDGPAGDIGVGGREIGYMFGQYTWIRNEFTGVLTGKGINWGGSLIRPEATGYGNVYFAQNMLEVNGDSFKGKTVAISGSGNVAQYACEKATELGAKVVTLSDSSGYIYDSDGIKEEKLAFVKYLKILKEEESRNTQINTDATLLKGDHGQLDVTSRFLVLHKMSLNDETENFGVQWVYMCLRRGHYFNT